MFDKVLNMLWLEFWIFQGSEYVRVLIYQDSVYTRVIRGSEYAWVFPEYKSACKAFVLHVPVVIPCELQCQVTYFNKVCKLRCIKLFPWCKIWFFSTVAGSIWFFLFCFRVNTFTSTISNLLLHFGAGCMNLAIPLTT